MSADQISRSLANKRRANALKEMGNNAFKKQKFEEAERFYSEGIEMFSGLKKLWTNRAMSRNQLQKYEEAISDCDSGTFSN